MEKMITKPDPGKLFSQLGHPLLFNIMKSMELSVLEPVLRLAIWRAGVFVRDERFFAFALKLGLFALTQSLDCLERSASYENAPLFPNLLYLDHPASGFFANTGKWS